MRGNHSLTRVALLPVGVQGIGVRQAVDFDHAAGSGHSKEAQSGHVRGLRAEKTPLSSRTVSKL